VVDVRDDAKISDLISSGHVFTAFSEPRLSRLFSVSKTLLKISDRLL